MPPKCTKNSPAKVTYCWRSHATAAALPSQGKGRHSWAGSSSCFSPCTACAKAFPGARPQVCTPPPTIHPRGPFKTPAIPSRAPAGPASGTHTCPGHVRWQRAHCLGRHRRSCQPLAQPFPASEKAPGPVRPHWGRREKDALKQQGKWWTQ